MDVLTERLAREWRYPDENAAEPVIFEERPVQDARANHLYVVWSDWAELSPLERSRIVMTAYAQVKGADLANSVTLAMGLTPEEARKLKLPLD